MDELAQGETFASRLIQNACGEILIGEAKWSAESVFDERHGGVEHGDEVSSKSGGRIVSAYQSIGFPT